MVPTRRAIILCEGRGGEEDKEEGLELVDKLEVGEGEVRNKWEDESECKSGREEEGDKDDRMIISIGHHISAEGRRGGFA
ncbi:unnamed protein product [Amaranthus hypochondriacus]